MAASPFHPPYDDERDAAMLRGIANGDRECFRGLYERYDGLLFTVIDKVLNDRDDSEEVLQEVMGSLWRKATLFESSRGRAVTWLTSMARNRAIDRLRSKQRHSRLKTAYSEEMMALPPRGATGPSGAEAATRRDNCQRVRSAVLELTEVQREAIEKVYFEGLSQQEIADQLGQPLGTVKARIRRGLASLRRSVDTSMS